jgi:hypothetical protein
MSDIFADAKTIFDEYLTDLYPHRCTIKTRSASTADGLGQPSHTWSAGTANQQCRFEGESKRPVSQDFVVLESTPLLTVPGTVAIAPGDKISSITLGGVSFVSGEYSVLSVHPGDGQGGHKIAVLEIIENR